MSIRTKYQASVVADSSVMPLTIGSTGTLYGARKIEVLKCSLANQDSWEWELVCKLPDGLVVGMYEFSSTLLIVCMRDGKCYTVNLETEEFELTHTHTSGYSYTWSFTTKPDGTLFISEYGDKGKNDNPRRVYKTTDGYTWDFVCQIDHAYGRHVHKILFDKYEDSLWLSQGDGDSKLWKALGPDYSNPVYQTRAQPTAGVVVEDGIFWGQDGGVNRIEKWDRTTNTFGIAVNLDVEFEGYGGYIFDMDKLSDGTILALSAAYNNPNGLGAVWSCKAPDHNDWEMIWSGQTNYMMRILVGKDDKIWFTSQCFEWKPYRLIKKPVRKKI